MSDTLPLCKCPFGTCDGKADTSMCKRDEILKTTPKVIEEYESSFGPMKRSER